MIHCNNVLDHYLDLIVIFDDDNEKDNENLLK